MVRGFFLFPKIFFFFFHFIICFAAFFTSFKSIRGSLRSAWHLNIKKKKWVRPKARTQRSRNVCSEEKRTKHRRGAEANVVVFFFELTPHFSSSSKNIFFFLFYATLRSFLRFAWKLPSKKKDDSWIETNKSTERSGGEKNQKGFIVFIL